MPEKRTVMFGQMMVEPVLHVAPSADLEESLVELIKVTENPEIVRWMIFQTRSSCSCWCQVIQIPVWSMS